MNHILHLLVLVLVLFCCTQSIVKAQNWPKHESLLLFLPFDSKNGLNDVAKGLKPSSSYSAQLETSKSGPFGIANSSYTVSQDNSKIARYNPLPSFPSFTFSTYFFVGGEGETGGIVNAYGSNPNRFSLLYKGDALEVHRFASGQSYSVESFTIRNFFQSWTFICLTYDHTTKTVTLLNQFGVPVYQRSNFPILDKDDLVLYVGEGRNEKSDVSIHTGDAIACTMIYNSVLKQEEIAQLSEVCFRKGAYPPPATPWPEPDALVGYWPLSSQYKSSDLSNNDFHSVCQFCFLSFDIFTLLVLFHSGSSL